MCKTSKVTIEYTLQMAITYLLMCLNKQGVNFRLVFNLYVNLNIKVSPDWICAVTSRFTKLFYCESANTAHIQSGDTLVTIHFMQIAIEVMSCSKGLRFSKIKVG